MNMEIQKNVPLAEYTTLHIGGPAEYVTEVKDVPELRSAALWAKERGLPLTILGGGSNVFAADAGVRGLVARIAIAGREVVENGDEVLLTLGAGEVFDDAVLYAVSRGWWGLENLSCIPGSVGASPIQNIGAYGAEIQEVIAAVEAYDTERDETVTLLPAECAFGYRDSLFKHEAGKHYVITRVSYRLSKQPRPNLAYADVAALRRSRTSARQCARYARRNSPTGRGSALPAHFSKIPLFHRRILSGCARGIRRLSAIRPRTAS